METELQNPKFFKEKKIVPELKLRYIATPIKSVCLDSTEKVIDLLREIFDEDTFQLQEEIVVLLIDEDERPIGFTRLAKGTKDHVGFSSHDIFSLLCIRRPASFIVAHNHPNGDINPSTQDMDFTFELRTKTNYLGFTFADKIILTVDDYYSFKERNLFWEYS